MKDKILLVDDDEMVLAGLKRQLRNHFSIDTRSVGRRPCSGYRRVDPTQ